MKCTAKFDKKPQAPLRDDPHEAETSPETRLACGHLSEYTVHAIADHFQLIESEMAQIRRLLLEELGL
jgi:hypothetical protein